MFFLSLLSIGTIAMGTFGTHTEPLPKAIRKSIILSPGNQVLTAVLYSVVLLHDAFKGLSYWSNFMTDTKYQGVAFDTHIYQVFSQAVRSHMRFVFSPLTDLLTLHRKSPAATPLT